MELIAPLVNQAQASLILALRASVTAKEREVMLLSDERQREILLSELKSLSETLHRRFYAHVKHWQPLDDPRGILSQIDNMTAGMLMRIEQLEAAVTWVSPEFVDEATPEPELRKRIAFLNRDAERKL